MSKFISLVLVVLFVFLGWRFAQLNKQLPNDLNKLSQQKENNQILAVANAENNSELPTKKNEVTTPQQQPTKLNHTEEIKTTTKMLSATLNKQPQARARLSTAVITIYFDSGLATLSNSEELKLRKFIESVKSTKLSKIQLHGYTDSLGTNIANTKISAARINSIIQYLKQQGVQTSFEKKILGSSNAIESNNTALGRANNRRVEITAY